MNKKAYVLMIIVAFTGCTKGGMFGEGKKPVTIEKVWVDYKYSALSYPGVLEAPEELSIVFPIDLRIKNVPVQLGAQIKEGDLLFTIDEESVTLQLSKLKNDLFKQEALLEKNIYFLNNRERLFEEGKIDQAMYDTIEAETKALEGEVKSLQAQIEMLNKYLKTDITSTVSGMVTQKEIAAGSLAKGMSTLMRITQVDPMNVRFMMDGEYANAVAVGTPVEVKIANFETETETGTIRFVSPGLEPGKSEFAVLAAIDNKKRIYKVGMEAQITLKSPRKIKTLSIPKAALLTAEEKKYVFVVRENKAFRVRVRTHPNAENSDLTEITEGLQEEDLVVTQGLENLKNGDEVNLWR